MPFSKTQKGEVRARGGRDGKPQCLPAVQGPALFPSPAALQAVSLKAASLFAPSGRPASHGHVARGSQWPLEAAGQQRATSSYGRKVGIIPINAHPAPR